MNLTETMSKAHLVEFTVMAKVKSDLENMVELFMQHIMTSE